MTPTGTQSQKISTGVLTTRFTDIFDPSKVNSKITIVGAGTIGSNVALNLARLGVNFEIYDDDIVEDYNLGYQQFFSHHIGSPKVEAVASIVESVAGTKPKAIIGKAERVVTEILILCVDNMEARKKIVEASTFLTVIDGRMGGEIFNVYTCKSKEEYLKTWHSDDDSKPEPCGAKAIGYIGTIIGGIMANQVKKTLNKEKYNPEINFATNSLAMETSCTI